MRKKTRKQKPRQPHPAGNPAQVHIETPGGHRLRFSESLIAFVVNRPEDERRRGFRLGDWIASLDGDTLGHLGALSEQAMLGGEPPAPAGADLLSVAVHATAAERGVRKVEFDEEKAHAWLAALCVASTLERFRRDGLVEFDGRTSIESPPAGVAFTEKGMAWQAQAGGGAWLN